MDVAIPANNKGRESIGVLYYILAKTVLHMRGSLAYNEPWDVQVDLFFYKYARGYQLTTWRFHSAA